MITHWTPGAIAARAREVFREEGIRALVFRVLGETVYRRVIVTEFLLGDPTPTIVPDLPIQIELLQADQIEEYLRFRPNLDRMEIQKRLDQKQWCFAAWHKGRIVAATWVAARRTKINYLTRHIDLAPDVVYVYESLALPEFRRANIASAIGVHHARFFHAAGYRRQWAVIVPENKPGWQLAAKKGYRRIGTMGYVKIGPWRHDFVRWDPHVQPTERSTGVDYWGDVLCRIEARGHYLDTFLAEMKRRAYLSLITRWGGAPESGYVLKTDLFEEATGADAFMGDLRRKENHVIGIDISRAAVERARLRNYAKGISCIVADVRWMPFAGNAFAFIISPSTLDHFSDLSELGRGLEELARILAPGGRAIVTLDNRQNLFDPLFRLVNRLGWLPYYVGQSFTIAELRKALETPSLHVQGTEAILHNPRLVATGMISLARKIGWQPLIRLVQQTLVAMQKLGETPMRYYTGSFIAAAADKPKDQNA